MAGNRRHRNPGKINDLAEDKFINVTCTEFDGVNEYVSVADHADFQFERTDTFSISAWIKNTATVSLTVVSKKSSSTTQPGWYFIVNSSGRMRMYLWNTTGNAIEVETDEQETDDNLWHNVVMTYDGTSNASGVTIYVDGRSSTTTLTQDTLSATIDNTRTVNIGMLGSASNPYNGRMCNVAIWDKELSADEAMEIYNNRKAGNLFSHSAVSNIVSWWKGGDGDTFSTWTDSVGSHDGTMTNMESGDFKTDAPDG